MNQLAKFEHLKYIISNLPSDSINLEVWHGNTPCGTYACVGGHACLDAEFKAEGLSLYNSRPYYRGYSAYKALQYFFEIDWHTARLVFCPFAYNSYGQDEVKNEIIDHINEVIKELSSVRK